MTNEEQIQQELTNKFPFLADKVVVKRTHRLFTEPIAQDKFMEVFDYIVKNMGFVVFCTMTGLDEGENLTFIYHMSKENGIMLNIKTFVPKANPVIKTITTYFPAADIPEREVMDLLGAKVDGLPAGRRYPLPDNFPTDQFPLRKDWNLAAPAPQAGSKEEAH